MKKGAKRQIITIPPDIWSLFKSFCAKPENKITMNDKIKEMILGVIKEDLEKKDPEYIKNINIKGERS